LQPAPLGAGRGVETRGLEELSALGAPRVPPQVRVMPRCWYALLRFFLRVDGVLVRLREVRLFCRLDGAAAEGGVVVLREVRRQEGTFAELAAGGAPPAGPAYADAEAAAVALAAVAPVGVARYALERAVL
jgi:type 2A phosphatase activator TIP41